MFTQTTTATRITPDMARDYVLAYFAYHNEPVAITRTVETELDDTHYVEVTFMHRDLCKPQVFAVWIEQGETRRYIYGEW